MTEWTLRDGSGRVKRVRGPRRFAEQFEAQGFELEPAAEGAQLRTLAHFAAAARAPRERPPAQTRVTRVGSVAARAKRARIRARLDAGGHPFIRRLIEALIDAGALDSFQE